MMEVPSVDRGPLDHRNLICVIVSVDEHQQYKLATKKGFLKGTFSRNYFDICKRSVLKIQDVDKTKEISIREACTQESKTGGQGVERCQCKGQCKNRQCSCKNAGILCNSKCHIGTTCCNKFKE